MSKHARLSPSNHRWPNCPGSVREEARYPDVPGEAAIDGTGTHILNDDCSQHGHSKADYFLNQTIGAGHEDRPQGWLVKQDRCDRSQMFLDYLARRRSEINGKLVIQSESQVNPGIYFNRNDWYGTSDTILHGSDFIEIIDYKDGRTYVNVKNNSQFDSYGVGAFGTQMKLENIIDVTKSRIKMIRLTVVQPKTHPVVRYEDITPLELWRRGTLLAQAAAKTDDPNAPLISGEWCTWCLHGRADNCAAKNEIAMKGMEAMDIVSQTNRTPPKDMTNERLAEIFDAWPLIKKTYDAVEAEIMVRLDAGLTVSGCMIGTGRGKKEFIDDEDVIVKKLKGMRFKKGDIYPAKLISPAQALKHPDLTDRQIVRIKEMIKEVDGDKKVVKAKVHDKPTPEDMFGAVAKPVGMSFM